MADPNETMTDNGTLDTAVRNPADVRGTDGEKTLVQKLRTPALFAAWVIGLMLISSLVWVLIRPALSEKLMESINYSLSAQGEENLLSRAIPSPLSTPSPKGLWFAYENSANRVFVFTILHDGIMIPCGAKITRDGKVMNIFLLSHHALQMYDRLPPGIFTLYISRIEKAFEMERQK